APGARWPRAWRRTASGSWTGSSRSSASRTSSWPWSSGAGGRRADPRVPDGAGSGAAPCGGGSPSSGRRRPRSAPTPPARPPPPPAGINALPGTAISLTVTDLPIAVQDLDQTPLSRQYVDAFRSSLTFRLVSLPPATPPETMLVSDRARAVLIIPEHFARDVRRGRTAEAQVLVDASDANTARLVQGG